MVDDVGAVVSVMRIVFVGIPGVDATRMIVLLLLLLLLHHHHDDDHHYYHDHHYYWFVSSF